MPPPASNSPLALPPAARMREGGVAASCMVLHRRLDTPLYVSEQEVEPFDVERLVDFRCRIHKNSKMEGVCAGMLAKHFRDGKAPSHGKIFFFGVAA